MVQLSYLYMTTGKTIALNPRLVGKIEGRRRREQQRTRWLNGITNSMDMHLGKFREMVKHREAWHAAFHGDAMCQI